MGSVLMGSDTTKKLMRSIDQQLAYRTVFENSLVGKLITDEQDVVRACNKSVREMFGQDLIGENEFDLVWPEDRWLLKKQVKNRKAGESSRYELSWRRKDGERIYTRVLAVPLLDEQGNYIGNFGEVENITELREITERARTTAILRMFAQNATATIHNLNHNTGIGMGYVGLLLEHETDPKKIKYLKTVLKSLDNIDFIAKNYLSLGRSTSGQRERCDLGVLVNETTDYLSKSGFLQGHQIVKDVYSPLPVKADKTAIQQALINIFKNSKEAIGEKTGMILVRTRISAEGYGEFYIEDNGCGIPGMNHDKIFQIYTSKKDGSGIGLYTARDAIVSHGGYLFVDWSEVGKGARILGGLPLLELRVEPGHRKERNT
ncbi:PAS domain S-box protein [Candidatus Woesearchaeota archaeon]|nr:PAS domain S-box protein [Candidatus Woesearchaeota archaeon]